MFILPCSLPDAIAQEVIALPDMPFVIPVPIPPDNEWPHFRQNVARTGAQRYASNLSDPTKVTNLSIKWSFPAAGPPIAFRASPIVVNDTVFVGSEDGTFYALEAATGRLKWQYPRASESSLRGPDWRWSHGFLSSAAYWDHRHAWTTSVFDLPPSAVIFGAQDPSLRADDGKIYGSARLFALDPNTGVEIWRSEPVATINGDNTAGDKNHPSCNPPSPTCYEDSLKELHQRIAFSPPLIFNNKVYVGIHDTRDDPIQTGRVIAVNLADGHIERVAGSGRPTFQFQAVGTPDSPLRMRGGGVWNALATDGTGVYFTTGNTRIPWCVNPPCGDPDEPEPSPNYGLSMIRVDKDTGNVIWHFNAVPFDHDGDPDWAAGAAVMSTSCGNLIASVQKDGWSYAVDAGNGSLRWQFPPTISRESMDTFLGARHGDDDYRRPGAAWNDVFIVRTGGENVVNGVASGYEQLHAINACAATESDRVRWIADLPNIMEGHTSYSTPTVTGGIVFIGTNKDRADHKGHLVVLGDPSVVPPDGQRCSNTAIEEPTFCRIFGYDVVPIPAKLADFAMPDGGSLAAMRSEPVLAKGRVFVATHPCDDAFAQCDPNDPGRNAGHVYMLEP